MKDFTKYLPIEGEIKQGDKYIRKNAPQWGVSIACACPDQILWRKVQLFLCSRDIQVGDKVWDTLNEKFCEVTTPFVALHTSDGENVPCWYLKTEPVTFHEARFLIKVIGPISPETTWVKEGDEFREDQWRKTDLIGLPIIFQIQCPICRQFN